MLLLAGQHEQLSVDDKQLGDGVFEAAAGVHGRTDRIDPLPGNGLDALFAIDHEGEGVERMAGFLGAMATWFPAAPVTQRQRSGQCVPGDPPQARQKRALATFESGGIGSSGSRCFFHLIVVIQSDRSENKTHSKCLRSGFANARSAQKRKVL